jgi:BirA family biotin operon repressor/biotin-[acetyl-CoA-carboxylase] ligase
MSPESIDRLLPARVKMRLTANRFGRRVYYYPEIDSTNRAAMDLARRGESEGTVVVTDFQTAGKGRLDHTWSSPPGKDLLFSIVLRPEGPPAALLPVTLVLSGAAAAVLSVVLEEDVGVKWPNDLIARGGKIGGVLALAEVSQPPARGAIVVAGIGVNVNSDDEDFPAEIRGRATSLLALSGKRWDRAGVLARLLESLEAQYDVFQREGFDALRTEYESRLVVLGKRVSFERAGIRTEGVVAGVNDDGALRVDVTDENEPSLLYNEEIRLGT